MDKVYEDVKGYIDAIAENLGVAAEHVYELLVKQQVIEGAVGLIVGGIILLVSVLIITMTFIAKHKATWHEGHFSRKPTNGYASYINFGEGVVCWIVFGMAVLAVIICTCVVAESALQLFNPEYYAIKEIMDVFKGGE